MGGDQAAAPRVKGIVFRVTGIPTRATLDEISAAISSEFEDEGITLDTKHTKICPSCYSDKDKIAFVQFTPHSPIVLDDLPNGDTYEIEFDSRYDISIDKDFYGLTQLYPTQGEISADIVALSGLNGHAYGSWRGRGNRKRMWLQDFFDDDFPNCRTMIYGYNSSLTSRATHKISDFTERFLEELVKARRSENEKNRPIVFIGHSFGGIVIAHSLVKAKDYGGIYESLLSSTCITFFFGTPHRGLVVDDILNMLGDNSARNDLVKSIQQQSKELKADLNRFIGCSTRFKIVSFIETGQTQKVRQGLDGKWSRGGEYSKTVEDESSMLQLPRSIEETLPTEGDHSTMVKFKQRGDPSYTSVVKHLKNLGLDTGMICSLNNLSLGTGMMHIQVVLRDYVTEKRNTGVEGSYITPYSAVVDRNPDALKRIFELKVIDTNQRYKGDGTTLLHIAASNGDEDAVSVLLKYKADTEAVDLKDNTALHLATRYKHVGVAKILLKNGARVNATCNGATALHMAAQYGYNEMAVALLENGANITVRDNDYRMPIHRAAVYGHEKMVELLLDNGAGIEAVAEYGYTPLQVAAFSRSVKVVELLLKKGANIDAVDGYNQPSLYQACCGNFGDIVDILLKNGANTKIRNHGGKMPIDTARERGFESLVKILQDS